MDLGVFLMALSGLFNLFIPLSMAIDPSCDYYQQMEPGQQYYIYNREYPNNYVPPTSCRWIAQGPVNTRIVMSCDNIELPTSSNCQADRLSVSVSGREDLQDAKNYCGRGTLSVVSEGNTLVVGLSSAWNSQGGRFVCSLTAVQDTMPTSTQRPQNCDCGWKRGLRITGGHETGVNEYPAMAGIVDFLNREVRCGGTILSNRYVMTAGHCLENRTPREVGVLVGDHNTSTGSDTPYSRLYTIEEFRRHPQFSIRTLAYDIAIVRTSQDIEFSLFVGPACLPFRFSSQSFEGQTVTALGWGLLEDFGEKSDTLQEVDLTVVSTATCSQQYTDRPVTNDQICTYAYHKDSCQNDSGGPLFWLEQTLKRLFVVGVISFGKGCGLPTPSVNTRVTSYLTWIISVTPDANYCFK